MNSIEPPTKTPLEEGIFRRYPALAFVLPLLVYLLVGSLEPLPPGEPPPSFSLGLRYEHYPAIYLLKVVLSLAAIAFVWRGYRAFQPVRVSRLALAVGVVGAGVWIALAHLERQSGLGGWLGLGKRSAFDPFTEMATPTMAYAFLAIRWTGLVLIVPLIEEMFLRGFLMRYITTEQWVTLPLNQVSRAALVAGTAVPMLMHPQELLASLVWFSAVSWLMLKKNNIWDCVTAHCITNLLLGCYVLYSGEWWLM